MDGVLCNFFSSTKSTLNLTDEILYIMYICLLNQGTLLYICLLNQCTLFVYLLNQCTLLLDVLDCSIL